MLHIGIPTTVYVAMYLYSMDRMLCRLCLASRYVSRGYSLVTGTVERQPMWHHAHGKIYSAAHHMRVLTEYNLLQRDYSGHPCIQGGGPMQGAQGQAAADTPGATDAVPAMEFYVSSSSSAQIALDMTALEGTMENRSENASQPSSQTMSSTDASFQPLAHELLATTGYQHGDFGGQHSLSCS